LRTFKLHLSAVQALSSLCPIIMQPASQVMETSLAMLPVGQIAKNPMWQGGLQLGRRNAS
jgi:hypothetical protein